MDKVKEDQITRLLRLLNMRNYASPIQAHLRKLDTWVVTELADHAERAIQAAAEKAKAELSREMI